MRKNVFPLFFHPLIFIFTTWCVQEDVRLREYGLICRSKEPLFGDDFGIQIRLDDQIRNFVNKGKIERTQSP
jgi:hypothetical protein